MPSLKNFVDAFRVKHDEVFSRGVKLQVVENDRVRMFKLDGATNSIINKQSVYTGGYWDYFIPLFFVHKNPRILQIGLGIGTMPYQFHSFLGSGAKMDIVELDPNVVGLARKYSPMALDDRIFVAEGADYVAEAKKKYDVIILDAYGKGANIPGQFFGEAFARNSFRILNRDGLLAIHYAMHPAGMVRLVTYRRLLKRFFSVYQVRASGGSVILLCSKSLGRDAMLKRIRPETRKRGVRPALVRVYGQMRAL